MSVRSARGALLSQGFLPTDWYFRWETKNMTVGTAAQPLLDESGNGRHGPTQDYGVAANVIGTRPVITKPANNALVEQLVPAHSEWRTAVWVFRPATVAVADFFRSRVGVNGSNGWYVYPSGQVAAIGAVTGQTASPALAANTSYVVVSRFRTPVNAHEIELRANGTVRNSRTSNYAAVAIDRVQLYPTNGGTTPYNVALFGMFDRRLTDDETAALEADLRAYYGF